MLQRVEPVLVPSENLDRRDQCSHPHRHGEHRAGVIVRPVLHQVPCPHRAHGEGRGEIGREHRMDQAIGKAGVEDDCDPALARQELAVRADLVTCRRLHPAVRREDPESGYGRARGHHQRSEEMQLPADPLHPEQHHAQEAGLEEKCRQHFIGHQRADHRAGLVGEYGPVRAELIGHHDARDDTHRESDREDLQPVAEQVEIDLPAGPEPEPFEYRQIARQPDREGGENEMEADREGELHPGKDHGIGCFEHGALPSTGLLAHGGRDIHPLPPDACLDYGMLRPR